MTQRPLRLYSQAIPMHFSSIFPFGLLQTRRKYQGESSRHMPLSKIGGESKIQFEHAAFI